MTEAMPPTVSDMVKNAPAVPQATVPTLETEGAIPMYSEMVKNKPDVPQSPTTTATEKQVPELRRSTRVREQRLVYDSATGESARLRAVSKDI